MDNTKELKQQYLRENILEKNYDAEEFMDYCDSQYGSIDIDSWSFQELKKVRNYLLQIVQQFIHKENHPENDFEMNFSNSDSISN